MSRVAFLVSARKSVAVNFLEFTRLISKNANCVAACFEGDDAKYYLIRLQTMRPEFTWHGINCKGKAAVIQLRSHIRSHPEYNDANCAFFIDRDFDDSSLYENISDLYITPCYSIENLYATETTFIRILNSEFGISNYGQNADCFALVLSTYQKRFAEYLQAIRDFNCWLRAQRKKEADIENSSHLNLNDIKLSNLVKVSLSECTQVHGIQDFKLLFPEALELTEAEIKLSETALNSQIASNAFRGKQNIDFFRTILVLLKQDCTKRQDRVLFRERCNMRLNLSKSNLLSELSQYADTPQCLRNFVNSLNIHLSLA